MLITKFIYVLSSIVNWVLIKMKYAVLFLGVRHCLHWTNDNRNLCVLSHRMTRLTHCSTWHYCPNKCLTSTFQWNEKNGQGLISTREIKLWRSIWFKTVHPISNFSSSANNSKFCLYYVTLITIEIWYIFQKIIVASLFESFTSSCRLLL